MLIGIQSCGNGKRIASETDKADSSTAEEKRLPGGLSISPNYFRAEAVIADKSVTDSKPPQAGYTLFIRNVLERGSSLIYAVSNGEKIRAELIIADGNSFLKGDTVITLIEERLQMNSDQPLFILKDIHKK